jgi:hypothetical protein
LLGGLEITLQPRRSTSGEPDLRTMRPTFQAPSEFFACG